MPRPLPPQLEPSWQLLDRLAQAERAVGTLNGIGRTLPNTNLLVHPFIRREAVLSSRIEGTEASIDDLVVFEAAGSPETDRSDVREVANYVSALEYGIERLASLPISLRFIREVHERLMRGVRGGTRGPGEFRRIQNWIGPTGADIQDASYVPPPVEEMNGALDLLEKFLHAPAALPFLIRCALVHYQFEAIHPFLDGNGRVGRLLIVFMLHVEGLLDQPLLYLSAFFERNREEYYTRLREVSQHGRWSKWIDYFLRGVIEQSRDAAERSKQLQELSRQYRNRLLGARSSAALMAIVDQLFVLPAVTITGAARMLHITYPAAKRNVEKLVDAGILAMPAGEGRNRIYVAREIIAAIE